MKRITILKILAFAMVFVAPAVVMSGPPGPVDNPPPEGWDVNILDQPIEVTGDVNATVSGGVSVTNTPNVNVVNDETNPVPVTLLNEMGKDVTPVHVNLVVAPSAVYDTYTVPDGMYLVIDHISFTVSKNLNNVVNDVRIILRDTSTDGTNYFRAIFAPFDGPYPPINTLSATADFSYSSPFNAVIEPNHIISLLIFGENTTNYYCYINGKLISID